MSRGRAQSSWGVTPNTQLTLQCHGDVCALSLPGLKFFGAEPRDTELGLRGHISRAALVAVLGLTCAHPGDQEPLPWAPGSAGIRAVLMPCRCLGELPELHISSPFVMLQAGVAAGTLQGGAGHWAPGNVCAGASLGTQVWAKPYFLKLCSSHLRSDLPTAAWSLVIPMVRAFTKLLCCFWLLDWAEQEVGGIIKIPWGYLWNPSLSCLGWVVYFFMKSFWILGLKGQNISWDWNCRTCSEHFNAEVDGQVGTPHQKVDSGKKWMMESIQRQTHNRKGGKWCFFARWTTIVVWFLLQIPGFCYIPELTPKFH